MRLYIDVTVLTLATFVTGIQRVTREYAVRLASDEAFDVVLLHYNASENAYHIINNQRFVDYYTGQKGRKEKMITRDTFDFERMKSGEIFFDLDAVWMSKVKRSYILPIIRSKGVKIIAHIYDIIPITHPQFCLERNVYNFMDYISSHLLYADEIIVNAKATQKQIMGLCEKLNITCPKTEVIPLGANYGSNKKSVTNSVSEKIKKAAEKPFVLMVGTIEPRKNHKMLLDAYDKGLKDIGFNIIMAGYMGWNMDEFKERLENHPDYMNGVYHFEGLDDNNISYLYENATCLAFLSYTEGYGLPIVEALVRNVPVIASDVEVLREVGGDRCMWVEEDNTDELVKAVSTINQDKDEEKHDDIHAISWDECYSMLSDRILRMDK